MEDSLDREKIQKASGLWRNYVKAKRALLRSGIARSYKSPEAEFSEWLTETVFNGERMRSQSHPCYDVVAGSKRISVKSICKMPDNQNGYIVKNKDRNNRPNDGATHYAFMFFVELIPDALFLVPEHFVRTFNKSQIRRSDLENTPYKNDVDLTVFKEVESQNEF